MEEHPWPCLEAELKAPVRILWDIKKTAMRKLDYAAITIRITTIITFHWNISV